MSWLKGVRAEPWRIALAAVAGLLLLTVLDSVVGLALNQRVEAVVGEALSHDVKLEDQADDLRAAVLDLRHYHRNIVFAGPTLGAVADFERAYLALREEVEELRRIGVHDPEAPQPGPIRDLAERYYTEFRPTIDRYESDRDGFARASDLALSRVGELEGAAAQLDKLGEERAAAALSSIEQATMASRNVQLAVFATLIPLGAALAYAASRTVGELRRLYAEQRQAAKELAQASRAKTRLVADVSHELRTPLTVLRGNAEVGLGLDPACPHTEFLEEIVKESARMSRMVDDLMFLARSDSDALTLELYEVELEPFLAELAGRAGVLARERGAVLQAAMTSRGRVHIDPARIQQAILVLVDNAAKYSPSDERVILTSGTSRGELTIEVADRGPGIPEGELARIFERFYRVDKARARKQGGTGLGLAIAKTIAEAHGGRIEVVSRLGEGTRMTLFLPLIGATRTNGHATERGMVEAGR